MQDSSERVELQRADEDPSEPLLCQPDVEPLRPGPCAARSEQRDRIVAQPAQRETDGGGRRRVEPLNVVDGQQDRRAHRHRAERCERGRAHGVRVDRPQVGRDAQERDVKRMTLRRGNPGADLLCERREQIGEGRMRERGFRLGGSSAEEAHPALHSLGDGCLPQGALADAGLALQNDPGGGCRGEGLADGE